MASRNGKMLVEYDARFDLRQYESSTCCECQRCTLDYGEALLSDAADS